MKSKRITLVGLVLMIFTAIFGFANTTNAYFLMGYAGIIWYVIAALLFFLPTALMFAEYGSSFKESKGGIYSWLAETIGERLAFIGTFIWLASWIIWMVSTASKVWIPLSAFIFGSDQTQSWHLFSLSSTQTIGLLAIAWILIVTFFASKGLNQISKISAIGGVFISALNIIFIIASVIVLFANKGLAEPIHGMQTFIKSPSESYQSVIGMISFIVFAIFAYAGMETMGGITDEIDKPEKNFPKGLLIATGVIAISYSLSIFLWGISANWDQVIGKKGVNIANITYVLMENLGLVLGKALSLSASASLSLGKWFARLTGLSMFMAYLGSFFVLVYSPLKSFIMGTPKALWPKKITETNEKGMPENAMWVQAIIVAVVIFLVSFGGKAASSFYYVLTLMSNLSATLPYLFLVAAFPYFKKRTDLKRPFEVFKSYKVSLIVTIVVMIVLIFGTIFTVLQPLLEGSPSDAFWITIGPIVFGLIAYLMFERYDKKKEK